MQGKLRVVIMFLAVGVVLAAGAGIYMGKAGKEAPVTAGSEALGVQVSVGNLEAWKQFLSEAGWGGETDCRMLSGERVRCENLQALEIIYTDQPQPYLKQTYDGKDPAFAGVGESLDGDRLKLKVFVERERLDKDDNKGFFVAHQVIWAVNTIFNPRMKSDEILELNQKAFGKYKNSNLLTVR